MIKYSSYDLIDVYLYIIYTYDVSTEVLDLYMILLEITAFLHNTATFFIILAILKN